LEEENMDPNAPKEDPDVESEYSESEETTKNMTKGKKKKRRKSGMPIEREH
jgi:hypothetical protein